MKHERQSDDPGPHSDQEEVWAGLDRQDKNQLPELKTAPPSRVFALIFGYGAIVLFGLTLAS